LPGVLGEQIEKELVTGLALTACGFKEAAQDAKAEKPEKALVKAQTVAFHASDFGFRSFPLQTLNLFRISDFEFPDFRLCRAVLPHNNPTIH